MPVCRECGHDGPEYLAILQEKDALIWELEKEKVQAKRRITTLLRKQEEDLNKHRFMPEAEEVFEYWREQLSPKSKEFNDERLRNTLDRLDAGNTVADICEAIDGAKARPYFRDFGRWPTGKPSERKVDLRLICKSEESLERFQGYAQEAKTGLITLDEEPLLKWQRKLTPRLMSRLNELRGWTAGAIIELGLGLDANRVVIPVRSSTGQLVGFVRYAPNPDKRNGRKTLAEGSRDLFPPPENYEGGTCWLVEGEPDAVAGVSMGLQAVGVPGVNTWHDDWPMRFTHFEQVIVCFDCDQADVRHDGTPIPVNKRSPAGREMAQDRASSLVAVGVRTMIVDLAPNRVDGFDIGDVLKTVADPEDYLEGKLAHCKPPRAATNGKVPKHLGSIRTLPEDPVQRVRTALEAHECRPKGPDHKFTARCPAHDDHNPSLVVSRGVRQALVLHCHTGCEYYDILHALRLDDLIPPTVRSS